MSVLVQYIVKVVSDVNRFVTTSEKFAPMMEEMGGRNGGVYEDENDPSLVSTISEWESHDQMHEAIEKYDDQFNEEAGTSACSGPPTSGIGGEALDRSHSRTASVTPEEGAPRGRAAPLPAPTSPSPPCSSPRHPSWSGSPPWD